MVALNYNFTEERDAGVRKQQSEKSADCSIPASRRSPRSSDSSVSKIIDQRSRITDQKRRTSNDLFIDHYSLVIERSTGANEIIYCGYRYDPESELYYVRNRTYSPVLGRWLQRDPIGYHNIAPRRYGIGQIDTSMNLYLYVSNQPAVGRDPSGLWWYSSQGPSGPVWNPQEGGCVIYFQRYSIPSWYNCIFGCPATIVRNIYYPLNGLNVTQQQCRPGGIPACNKDLLCQDVINAILAEQGEVSLGNQAELEASQWVEGILAGGAGEVGGQIVGGAGGVHAIRGVGESLPNGGGICGQ